MLYLVSTPIGNMMDITFRAVETFKRVDIICAEHTKRIRRLLSHYKIPLSGKRVVVYTDYNAKKLTPFLIKAAKEGKKIALVSDNGTPNISDPGYYLVNAFIEEGIEVSSIPGPCAFVAGATVSGFPTNDLRFLGFFPKKTKKRKEIMEKIKNNGSTFIIYESPHRIQKTLEFLKQEIPDYDMAVARELTKKFEQVVRGKVKDIKSEFKGELVLLLRK